MKKAIRAIRTLNKLLIFSAWIFFLLCTHSKTPDPATKIGNPTHKSACGTEIGNPEFKGGIADSGAPIENTPLNQVAYAGSDTCSEAMCNVSISHFMKFLP